MSKSNEGSSCITVLTGFLLNDQACTTGSSEGSYSDSSDFSTGESICSYQAWETDKVWDSGEDSSSTEFHFKTQKSDARKEPEKDEVLLAGSESSTTDTILLTRSPSPCFVKSAIDTWKCVSCEVDNEWPLRYCTKCYRVRKGWLPKRPQKRRKKNTATNSQSSFTTSSEVAGTSQESVTAASSFASQLSHRSDMEEAEVSGMFCAVCGVKPCDAVFLHGHTAHQMCCFSCSKKVWPKRRDCPICRRKVENVIKVFRQRPVTTNT